ncbi:MAG: DUF4238 domain-containing protein [Sedimentisphaerales bacterium]|nr:DUF4238 domain-containing protein [Sedimentisphaerales bacterium]
MSKKRAKRNHILPKEYLRRFSQNEKIWVLDFETKKQNNPHIQEAAIIKDFYTVKTICSQKDDLIEQQFLSDIERKCDPAIDEVINNHTFSKGDTWALLAKYIALMYVRGPLFRQIILETFEQFYSKTFDELLENEEMYYDVMNRLIKKEPDISILPFEEMKKIKDEFEISPDIPRTFYVVQMMNFAANMVHIIHNMTPNLFCVRKYLDTKFITGDVPVIPIPRQATNDSMWIWINNPDADLYFPISSHCCLVLNYDSLRKCNTISPERIAWINHLIACNCTRIVLSEEKSFYWTRENRTISNDVNEIVESWGEEKKTRFRGALIDKIRPSKVRNDWGYLRSKDPEN